MRLLVTGFLPWEKGQENPTEDIAKVVDNKKFHNVQVHGRVLPVSWEKTGTALKNAVTNIERDFGKLDAILSFGLFSGIDTIHVETTAWNWKYGSYKDQDEQTTDTGPIVVGGPLVLPSTLPTYDLIQSLTDDSAIPEIAVKSDSDCECFLCNVVHYTQQYEYGSRIPFKGFIHVGTDSASFGPEIVKKMCEWMSLHNSGYQRVSQPQPTGGAALALVN